MYSMKSATLGELEQQIMDIVWERKSCTAGDVLTRIQREKKLAYTTVATILQRLYHKGLLNRKEIGVGNVYFPKVSKEKYTKNVAGLFLKNFMHSFGDIAIVSFADSIDKLPSKKRGYFLKLLEEHDKNK